MLLTYSPALQSRYRDFLHSLYGGGDSNRLGLDFYPFDLLGPDLADSIIRFTYSFSHIRWYLFKEMFRAKQTVQVFTCLALEMVNNIF